MRETLLEIELLEIETSGDIWWPIYEFGLKEPGTGIISIHFPDWCFASGRTLQRQPRSRRERADPSGRFYTLHDLDAAVSAAPPPSDKWTAAIVAGQLLRKPSGLLSSKPLRAWKLTSGVISDRNYKFVYNDDRRAYFIIGKW